MYCDVAFVGLEVDGAAAGADEGGLFGQREGVGVEIPAKCVENVVGFKGVIAAIEHCGGVHVKLVSADAELGEHGEALPKRPGGSCECDFGGAAPGGGDVVGVGYIEIGDV
ncbi:hypothetical protein GCM10009621_11230 [Corynebacterium felinum]